MRAWAVGAILGLAGAAVAVPALAANEGAADDAVLQAISHCAHITPDDARLACYDGLMPRVRAAMAQPRQVTPAQPAPQVAAAPAKEDQKSWFGFDLGSMFSSTPAQQTTPAQFGIENTAQAHQQREHAEQELDSITAQLADYAYNPFGKFIITLVNGQIWKQISSDDGHAVFSGDPRGNTVKIERGALGSYVLTINGSNRVYKVIRIK